jgi:hypothetical protein
VTSAQHGNASTSTGNVPSSDALIDPVIVGPAAKPGNVDFDRIDVEWRA